MDRTEKHERLRYAQGSLLSEIERLEAQRKYGERTVDLADVFGYGPAAPDWKEPA